MARDKLTEYSATASENTVCGDVNIAENSALPSDMNNYAREIMTHLKNFSDGTDAIDALTVTGDLTVDTNTLFVDASADKVGINEATPSLADLEIYNSTAAGATMLALVGESNNTGDTSGYTVRNSILFGGQATTDTRTRIDGVHNRAAALGGELVFNTCTSGGSLTEKARFLANGGLTFNGDTAAANALDDYEEGTWTPQISATDGIGTLTYSAQVGHYTKIGNRVNFHMYVLINQKGTVAGSIRYTLPFSSASVTNLYTAVSFWVNGSVNGQVFDGDFHLQAYIAPGSSIVVPQSLDGDGGVTHLNAGHISNGMDVMIAGHYSV